MAKVRLTREEFVAAIERIQRAVEQIDKLSKDGLNLDDDSAIWGLIYGDIEFLINAMGDEQDYPAISEFCWDNNFGEDELYGYIEEENGKPPVEITASTPNELYDFILKFMGLEELK